MCGQTAAVGLYRLCSVPALFTACMCGQTAAVGLLLRLGADPNSTCRSGATPLFGACANGHGDIVKVRHGGRSEPGPLPAARTSRSSHGHMALVRNPQRHRLSVVDIEKPVAPVNTTSSKCLLLLLWWDPTAWLYCPFCVVVSRGLPL